MSPIRHLVSRLAAAAVTGYLVLCGSSAFAQTAPEPPTGILPTQPPSTGGPSPTNGGSPIWMFVVVAILAAVAALVIDHVVARRRPVASTRRTFA